ncbi:MAG TPA: hypothetical protein VKI65_08920, partial [Gemmataceae bacterium]|nr:hypothetical protein [Gemmataceae bacterium]
MTTLGKILILMHLGLSLLVTAIAFGVYTHPLDVKDPEYVFLRVSPTRDAAGKEYVVRPESVAEERLKLQEATSRFVSARELAENRWRRARENVNRAELERPVRQRWYAEQLEILRTGSVQPVAIVFPKDANGRIIMNRQGCPPILHLKDPLKSNAAYNQEYDQLDKQTRKELTAIEGLINEEKTLTDRLDGEDGKTKGLRHLVAEATTAIRNSLAEQESLNRLLYDPRGGDRLMTSLAEEELLRKRNTMLKERI